MKMNNVFIAERNLNPKAACLKRREEEKSDDLPGRPMNVNAEDLAQNVNKVWSSPAGDTVSVYLIYYFTFSTLFNPLPNLKILDFSKMERIYRQETEDGANDEKSL